MLFNLINNKDLLENFFEDWKNNSLIDSNKSLLKTDIQETENSFIFTTEIPGFKKENIKVSTEEGYLIIEANNTNQKENPKEEKIKYLKQERFRGSARRSFFIGENLKIEDIKGNIEEGLLKIIIPKKIVQHKEKRYLSFK